jgi:hypothetical protein
VRKATAGLGPVVLRAATIFRDVKPCRVAEVSEERAVSIFGVEEYAKQEARARLYASYLLKK